jgi:hypothetical protein
MIESIEPVLDAQPDGALAELRAYDRGDAVLAAIVRRIAWQIARTEQRATTAEAEVNKLTRIAKCSSVWRHRARAPRRSSTRTRAKVNPLAKSFAR